MQLSLALLKHAFEPVGTESAQGADLPSSASEGAKQTVAEHERKKPVRKPLSENLPRVPIEILPEEVRREGLDAFERIGTETREVLERRPASAVVVQLTYPKFVRKDRERNATTEVVTAPAIELPIERGVAGPTLLADAIVRRWDDHQPLNRLERIFAREGFDLSKSTLCLWHDTLRVLVSPLLNATFVDAYAKPYLCVDAT